MTELEDEVHAKWTFLSSWHKSSNQAETPTIIITTLSLHPLPQSVFVFPAFPWNEVKNLTKLPDVKELQFANLIHEEDPLV